MTFSDKILEQIEYIFKKADHALKTHDVGEMSGLHFVKPELLQEFNTTTEIMLTKLPQKTYLDKFKVINKDQDHYTSTLEESVGLIKALKQDILNGFIELEGPKDIGVSQTILDEILNNFHKTVRQLRSRHEDRTTLDVKDEYDVQDLLHGILKLFYNDIRPEEYTPSYAGSSSRMDFLLKNEKIIIEVKKTRDKLRDKEVGNQLIEDIERYKSHPDCKKLICFVYDPEGLISNPNGLAKDLDKSEKEFEVKVIIKP